MANRKTQVRLTNAEKALLAATEEEYRRAVELLNDSEKVKTTTDRALGDARRCVEGHAARKAEIRKMAQDRADQAEAVKLAERQKQRLQETMVQFPPSDAVKAVLAGADAEKIRKFAELDTTVPVEGKLEKPEPVFSTADAVWLRELREQLKTYPVEEEYHESRRYLHNRILDLERRERAVQDATAARAAAEEEKQNAVDHAEAERIITTRKNDLDNICRKPMTPEFRQSLLANLRERIAKLEAQTQTENRSVNGARVASVVKALAKFYKSMVRRIRPFTQADYANWQSFDWTFYHDAISFLAFRSDEERSLLCHAAKMFADDNQLPTDGIPKTAEPPSYLRTATSNWTYAQALEASWNKDKTAPSHYVYVPRFDRDGKSLWTKDRNGREIPVEGLEAEDQWLSEYGDAVRPRLTKRGSTWIFLPELREEVEYPPDEPADSTVLRTPDDVLARGFPREKANYLIGKLLANPGGAWLFGSDVGARDWVFFRYHELPSDLRRATDLLAPAQLVLFLKCDPMPNDGRKHRLLRGNWFRDDAATAELPAPADMLPVPKTNGNHGAPVDLLTVPTNAAKEFSKSFKELISITGDAKK